MSQSSETQDESARTRGVLVTSLQALRLPLALALLAYLALSFLISLIRIAFGEKLSDLTGAGLSFSERASNEQDTFLGLFTLLLLAIVIALAVAGEPLKLARPIVLTTLVLTGLGLLFGLIGTLGFFFVESQGSFRSTRDKIESTLLDLPVMALYVLFALVLLALISAKGLPRAPRAPRPEPQQQYGQQYHGAPQQGGIPGFPPVEQQPYGGYQQQQQPQGAHAYDPWQGYPQQGYQQQPYQPDPPYQPQEPAPYQPANEATTQYQQPQPAEPPPYQPQASEPAPYQPAQRPAEQAPWNQPQQAPYRPDSPAEPTERVDISKHDEEEPPPPAQAAQSPFAPYRPPAEERASTPPSPPAWPQQPTQQQAPTDDEQRPPEASQQQPEPDWYQDRRRSEAPEPPPYGGWSGPHL